MILQMAVIHPADKAIIKYQNHHQIETKVTVCYVGRYNLKDLMGGNLSLKQPKLTPI